MYAKLSGMTGTAWTEREEFQKIYDLDVVIVPTHRPMVRADQADLVYKNEDAKFSAVIEEIADLNNSGRPVLVGTTSVEKSERLHELLERKGVPHEVLNAQADERQAWVIAQAGRPGAVTIATNMAGRGVDILLGGNPDGLVEGNLRKEGITLEEATPEQRQAAWEEANTQCERDADRVRLLGGLHVLGTERHEARRIDNQLRGRAGRQGDPGSSRFFVSLEDELMRRFGGASIAGLMDKLGLEEDVPLEHPWVSRAIENAQQKVEAYNFDIRKHVVEYDDVLNRQRDVIYGDRDRVLFEENLKPLIMEWVEETLVQITGEALGGDRRDWDTDTLRQQVERIFPMPENFSWEEIERLTDREEDVDNAIYHLQMRQQAPPPPPPTEAAFRGSDGGGSSNGANGATRRPRSPGGNGGAAVGARVAGAKVGRNDPCPCGSGKKYKKCHGAPSV